MKEDKSMHIYVDADACPVIGIVERIAKSHNIAVTLLCDTNHYLTSDYSEVVYVGAGADAVVFYFSVVVFVVKFSVLHPAFSCSFRALRRISVSVSPKSTILTFFSFGWSDDILMP